MASVNRVTLVGRLTRDPETKTFASGGKVAQFGFAVTGQRKKNDAGEWIDEPCFLDCKAFNSEKGRKTADLVEQYLRKGHLTYLEGHLVLEQWDDKNGGGKRTALRVVVDDVQFLQPKDKDQEPRQPTREPEPQQRAAPMPDDEIPF